MNFTQIGSDSSRFAIYRGNDLTATLVAQTAILTAVSITSPFTTLNFVVEPGQNTYFTKDENIIIAYSSAGTTNRISIATTFGNTSLCWFNATDSTTTGFPFNPRAKTGAPEGVFCCRLIADDITPVTIIVTPYPLLSTPHNLTSSTSNLDFQITASNVPTITKEWQLFNGVFSGGHPEFGVNAYNLTTGAALGPSGIGGYTGEWVKIKLDFIKTFNCYRLSLNSSTVTSGVRPYDWVLLGSIDNINWTLIDTQIAFGQNNWVPNGYTPNITVPSHSVLYIGYVVTRNSNAVLSPAFGSFYLSEMDFFNI